MMSLWDALRMNMMISYQELVRTFLKFFSRTALISSLYLHSDAIFFASPKVNGSDEVPVLV